MTFRKYLVLAGVALFASIGDSLLSRGMKELGGVSLSHPQNLILAVLNPWVILGIIFLLGFFASYTTALSWADLTYVVPATSIGFVFIALIAKFLLHEQVTLLRWAGIVLITVGVSLVAGGPELTHAHRKEDCLPEQDLASARSER